MQHLEVIHSGRLGVNSEGKILFLSKNSQENQKSEKEYGYNSQQVEKLGNKFLIPGFVDTHIHAPQYVFTGTGTGLPLLEWLEKYTFNFESQFADVAFADEVYKKSVSCHLRNGTTTGVYFGTIHLGASLHLADTIQNLGQRAYVGKVNMDRNSPPHYIETTEASCKDTQTFVEALVSRQTFRDGLITPIITPRFVPTCSIDLMKFLGELAEKYSLPIQSHISENTDEVAWVSSLHPECTSYGDVYHRYGLMNEKTIMAHACYLTPEERDLMKGTKSGISHCPLSNISLNSGFMPLRDLMADGIKIGLGTDVSGGYSPSMLNAMRMAMATGTVHTVFNQKKALNYAEAFHLATVGGSELIGAEDKLGNFLPGKEFDALVVDPFCQNSPFDIFSHDTLESTFEKFIFLGDDRNITKMFVKGKEVKSE